MFLLLWCHCAGEHGETNGPDFLSGYFQTGGFFIECGANDGQFRSNTLELEMERNWTGLLIEADPILGKQLLDKHRKAWVANVCASPENSISEVSCYRPLLLLLLACLLVNQGCLVQD